MINWTERIRPQDVEAVLHRAVNAGLCTAYSISSPGAQRRWIIDGLRGRGERAFTTREVAAVCMGLEVALELLLSPTLESVKRQMVTLDIVDPAHAPWETVVREVREP